MPTSLSHSWTYAAPVADVRAMLFDPAFREAVCDAQHAVSRTVGINGDSIRVDYAQATAKLPGFAKKLVGETITIGQREGWKGDEAVVEILVPGKPGSAAGRLTLTPEGEGTRQSVDLQVVAKVPLVGGKVEAMIRDLLVKAWTKESQVGREWLAR
ncbi:DUF2505 domain-containing protein [Nocardioides sp. Kera G14]|uniref:DUF2505 domain-containing protein n=1 Tax=Nocardioides sp. Kera G14 TaxID=2884264 RepID=UPI001D0F82E4|nr:DUF2505 domain-containing protein [Nocardioides sp. Kera G14]UDY22818.1 DUF2505 domain-containing protein [Nocardioides sp. Kera G14]